LQTWGLANLLTDSALEGTGQSPVGTSGEDTHNPPGPSTPPPQEQGKYGWLHH